MLKIVFTTRNVLSNESLKSEITSHLFSYHFMNFQMKNVLPLVMLILCHSFASSDEIELDFQSIAQGLAKVQSQMTAQPTEDIATQADYIAFLKANYSEAEKTIDSLAGFPATLDEQKEILRKKVAVLENLHALGDATAGPRLNEIIKERLESPEPSIARIARRFVLVSHAGQFFNLEPVKQEKVLTNIQDYVLKNPPCEDGAAVASALLNQLMQATNLTGAEEFSQEVAHHFATSSDEKMQEFSVKFEGIAKRASLPGKTFEINGQTISGGPFDPGSLKEKVVLVDFWSSGCPHCHDEAPHLKTLYAQLQSKGFEIIGVALYDTRESAKNYLEEKAIPWPVLFDETAAGTNQHPIAKQYAITAVPTAILIGRDGKVISIQARGPELERLLQEQFPEMLSNSGEQN